MTDSEVAAWTRGHAVGARELKAAEKRWQVERSMLTAQRNARTEESERAREEIARLRRRWYRDVCLLWGLALAVNVVWLMGVI